MGNKKESHYASRVGKRSRKRRGFKGTLRIDNDLNTTTVNTVVSGNEIENSPVANPQPERASSSPESVQPQPPTARPIPVLPPAGLPSAPTIALVSEPTPSQRVCNNSCNQASPLEKSIIAAKIAKRKFRKLANRSADKLNRNSFLNKRKRFLNCQRKVIPGKTRLQSIKSKTSYKSIQGFKLIDSSILNEVLASSVCCIKCRTKGMCIEEYCGKQHGLSQFLRLTCKNCGASKNFQTSKRSKGFSEVNVRSVLASQPVGRAGLQTFCSVMNLPKPNHKAAYNNIQDQLLGKAKKVCNELLDRSATTLYEITKEKNPENIVDYKNDKFAKVGVSVDGTWMKRGHQSKLGVVFVQSVETGEVLDFTVKSLFCHSCAKHKKGFSKAKFEEWYDGHKDKCCVNHKGSADKMESEGAIEIFLRSMKRNLIFHLYIGDGDSSSFGKVKEACLEKYGQIYTVEKEECSGHVQKRMGTRLRDLKKNMKGKKLDDGRKFGGAKTRMTDKWIDDFQKFYGQAIRSNPGDKQGMSNAVWAIYYHCITSEEESLDQQHRFCPRDGWCKYWADHQNYNPSKRLDPIFRKVLKPIFDALSDDALLSRCLLGMTQNQNEAINGVLWRFCNKNSFCGLKKLELAACLTVGKFNSGEGFTSELLDRFGISPGINMVEAQVKKDKERVKVAEVKISGEWRLQRQEIRTKKKKKADKEGDNVTYFPGAFGLSVTPEIDLGQGSSNSTLKTSKNKKKGTQPKDAVKSTQRISNTKKPARKRKAASDTQTDTLADADIVPTNNLTKPLPLIELAAPLTVIKVTFVADETVSIIMSKQAR